MDPSVRRAWWKSSTVYQIYPRSFFDSNNDGDGDLNGVRAKLDYLKDLGAEVLWLCPIYPSPQADMGYDVSDYCDIDPRYGTLQDWDQLVIDIHARGMKILMEVVANHTSNEHPWFLESKASLHNPKHDWYIWRPPRYEHGIRHPPNNWASIFQGSAWEYVPERGEYYLHLFSIQQPDLNWENPAVRDAMADVMRFWISRGCDGFRLDAINAISKTPGLPNARVSDHTQFPQVATEHYINGPRVHEYLHELYNAVLPPPGHDVVMTVGEAGFTFDPAAIAEYILPHRRELNQSFNFELMLLGTVPGQPLLRLPWVNPEVKDIVAKWQTYERQRGFWNTIFMENHDFGRSITRFGRDSTPQWRALSAKMLAVLQVTLRGTLYLYQGQEIGMKNFPRTWGIEEYKDVATRRHWNATKEKRQKETGDENPDMKDILDELQITARDHARIPMQWSDKPNVGFTANPNPSVPWMRAYQEDANDGWNVYRQSNNDPKNIPRADDYTIVEQSVLSFWKLALRTRKDNQVLIYGDFEKRHKSNQDTLAYVRRLGTTTAWVVINLSRQVVKVPLSAESGLGMPHGPNVRAADRPRLVLSSRPLPHPRELEEADIELQGYEARVYIK